VVLVTRVIDGDTLEMKGGKQMGSKGRHNVKKPKQKKEKKK
jgi:endonuclease YncB( thermonuclease family)